MRRLETLDFWPDLVALKDELSLRELSERFGVTPGAISAALKRTGTTRSPAPPGPRSARQRSSKASSKSRKASKDGDALPPEAGSDTDGDDKSPPPPRPGSKDHLLIPHWDLLGAVPDADVAREAGVSVRTVASYRARHEISGYSGPRRTSKGSRRRPSKIDAVAHLVGKVPDRVVAQEAGVSTNAVRNYRYKHGIPAVPRERTVDVERTLSSAGTTPRSGTQAWKVTLDHGGEQQVRVVLADDMEGAVDQSRRAPGRVVGLEWVGPLL